MFDGTVLALHRDAMIHALYDQTLKVLADSDPTAILVLLDALPRDRPMDGVNGQDASCCSGPSLRYNDAGKACGDHSMLTLNDLRESSFFQLILEEGLEKGIQQGIERGMEQGIEQGIERGRIEGEAALLRRQLERRFGPLPPWALERITNADRATVEAWGDRVLDAAGLTLDEFL